MPTDLPTTMRQIRSLVTAEGELQLSIAAVAMPQPADHEVLVRIDAAPINPSDLGLLLGMADVSKATTSGPADNPVVTAPVSPAVLAALAGRVGESMPVGNEGCGVVVAAGSIVDRSGGNLPDFGCPFVSLVQMTPETFPADALPEDLVGIPAVKPGSK